MKLPTLARIELEVQTDGKDIKKVALVADRYNTFYVVNLVRDENGDPAIRLRDLVKYYLAGQKD